MRIACLHTAQSNIEVFEAALQALGRGDISLRHEVRAELLQEAERLGGVTDAIMAETRAVLRSLCAGADSVLLNCSTLGGALAAGMPQAPVPVLRVDRALAEAASGAEGQIIVLCTVATTIAPTTALFEEVAPGRVVSVRLVPGAWAKFRQGDQSGYFAAIAAAVEAADAEGSPVVALAQASMAGAAGLVRRGRVPLTSPVSGLRAAVVAAESVLPLMNI
jgi:hypothetical protein